MNNLEQVMGITSEKIKQIEGNNEQNPRSY